MRCKSCSKRQNRVVKDELCSKRHNMATGRIFLFLFKPVVWVVKSFCRTGRMFREALGAVIPLRKATTLWRSRENAWVVVEKMSHDTLSSSLVLCRDEVQQPNPLPESREIDEPAVISARPENTLQEHLVSESDAVAALTGPSQWTLPSHATPEELEGAVAPPSVAPDLQFYQGTDVASRLPRRVMGHIDPSPFAHAKWGKEGDECAICLGVMAAGEHVSDLPGYNQICNHTFHLQCAAEWLTTRVEEGKKGCCPVCNAEIVQPILAVGRRPRAVSSELPFPWVPCIMSLLVLAGIILILYCIVQ